MGGGSLPSGTVTFLFTDIEGSTQLLQELGDDAFEVALSAHRTLLRNAFADHDGHEIGTEGDSFFVAFQNAADALRAALDGQLALGGHEWTRAPIRVRMGLHTGEANVADREYIGLAVHQAARISSAAHGGQVLVSQTTRDLIASPLAADMGFVDLGEHRLKDLALPVRLFNVTHPQLQAELPPPRTLSVLPNNLPIQLTSFIGREAEIAALGNLVESNRLVALTGAGGAGKTRLALQVASELLTSFEHGVWFVDLAPVTDPSLVLAEVAGAVHLRAVEGRSIEDVLLAHVQSRRLLILLDNCEHLAESCAQACERMLHASVELRVLATSREPLGVRGELVYRAPSLALPSDRELDVVGASEAVQLFCDRAALASENFTLTPDNASAVADICCRLDGLPLAIELAASRVRMFTAEEIAKRLDQRFSLLTGGTRTGLRRQQTLRAAVDWSYDLLSEQERALLRRLSVFAGAFTLDAAESICSGSGVERVEIVDLLSSLVDRSLVGAEPAGAQTRYRLLETIREYARELLAASDEAPTIWSSHLSWYADLATEAIDGFESADELEWIARVDGQLDNIRQALSWSTSEGDPLDGLRLAASLNAYWQRRLYIGEALTWVRSTMAACHSIPEPLRAQALSAMAALVLYVEGYEAVEPYAQECRRLPRTHETLRWIAWATGILAYVPFAHNDLPGTIALLEECIDIQRSIGHRYGEATTLNVLAGATTFTGRLTTVKELNERSIRIFEDLGVRTAMIDGYSLLASIALYGGDLDEMERVAYQMLELAEQIDDPRQIAESLLHLGRAAHERAKFSDARGFFDRALDIWRRLEYRFNIAGCLEHIAWVAMRVGDLEQAAAMLDESATYWKYAGPPAGQFEVSRAFVLAARGETSAARKLAQRVLETATATGTDQLVRNAGRALAWVYVLEADLPRARGHAERALEIAEANERFYGRAEAQLIAAKVRLLESDLDGASFLLREVIETCSRKGFVRDTGEALEMLGWVAAATGRSQRAAHLLGHAERMRETHGFVLYNIDLQPRDEAIEVTREALGDRAFAQAWERGQSTTTEEAVALALQA